MSDQIVIQEKDAAYLMVRHVCGHWERHALPENAEQDAVGAVLAAAQCRICEERREKENG